MKRPTISLACIAKNEANHVKRFLESFMPVVDEVIFVDTGSTDGTKEIAESMGAKVFHFDWINDFAAARNFSFEQVKTDYVLWADLDDALYNPEAFIAFRDHAMAFYDYVLAKYNYALDKDGKPTVTFARERILKMSTKPKWNYFVHEGVPPPTSAHIHYATTWAINHLRTEEDLLKDRSRNLKIFEEQLKSKGLDGRMTFYYGKELFENNQPEEAEKEITKSIGMDLQPHDRLNAMQYAALSCLAQIEKLKPEHHPPLITRLRDYSHRGLMLSPLRAEFWTFLGDSYLRCHQLTEALPYYYAAIQCPNSQDAVYAGPIHSTSMAYTTYPRMQIAKIYANLGKINEAEIMAKELHKGWPSKDSETLLVELGKIKPLIALDGPKQKVPDIVFTCPPQTAYEFDEELYKTKAMGGSETALIEMAKWLKKLTGRPVKVFNMRSQSLTSESGVEYISTAHTNEYFASKESALHIAWRHNIKVTNAPTYLWCHDLITQSVESSHSFDKILCLTPFHRDYVNAVQGVPLDKIIVTRNGIDPEKFKLPPVPKNPNKVVWLSSPDRGLDRAIRVMDIVREHIPEATLDVFYGLDNLYKYGMSDKAEELKKMMEERPWIKYHGFTEQRQMSKDIQDASVWIHPCNFIETFCITALETLASGIFPVTRRLGALANTLKEAEDNGMAVLLDHDCISYEEHCAYATEVVKAINNHSWEKIKFNPEQYAWSSVAKDWINLFTL